MRPGKMIKQVLSSVVKKPATVNYPKKKHQMPEGFRGKLAFYPDRCIGCRMCMRDCPSGAINIKKTEDGKFEAEIDLSRCIYCAQCVDSCIKKALQITSEFELAQLNPGKLKVVLNAGTAKENNQDKPEKS